jgi:glycosyltransferase involved in cell wall biosynthesis
VGQCSIRLLGRVDNPRFLSIVYSAADVIVCPSLDEAFGQVAMESVACGTPVVASSVGGLPDIVQPGESGWLCPPGDAEALRRVLEELMSHRERPRLLRSSCRHRAERSWALERQADDYLRVYEDVTQPA